MQRILSLTEIAALDGVCRRTIERAIEAGRGPVTTQVSLRRTGVTEADYAEWVRARRREPAVQVVTE